MIRVVIVDRQPLFVDGFRAALAAAGDMVVLASPATVPDAREALRGVPEIVVCDVEIPGAFQLLAEARRQSHPPAFVMIGSSEAPHYVQASLRLGALGFLLRTAPATEILDALRRVARGMQAYDVGPEGARDTWVPLTIRQRDVLTGLLAGRSNDEIGGDLRISRKTVEVHLSRLFTRTGSLSRTELAVKAEREGWLNIP